MPLLLNLKGPTGPAGADGADGADGAAGAAGADGATWSSGAGVPSDSNGVDGDFYLNETTGDVYKKVAGTWA